MRGDTRAIEERDIWAFYSFLRSQTPIALGEFHRLDGVAKGNRLPDAVAEPLVIEHTTLDSVPKQREYNFLLDRLISEIDLPPNAVEFALKITLPHAALGLEIDSRLGLQRVADGLRTYLITEASRLSDGTHEEVAIVGLPFRVRLCKNAKGIMPGWHFLRLVEDSSNFLSRELKRLITDKVSKNVDFIKTTGRVDLRSVVLVASDDIALMSAHKFLRAYTEAFPDGLSTSLIWFADTSHWPDVSFLDVHTGKLFSFSVDEQQVTHATWIAV